MILLHTIKYKESDLILYGYTKEYGRETFIIHNVGKKNKSLQTGLLFPLSILDISISGQRSDMTHIKDFSSCHNLKSIRENIYKSSITLFISELLYKTLKEPSQDTRLYLFLERSIVLLNSLEDTYSNFHLWFLIQYISILGYEPLYEEKEKISQLYTLTLDEVLSLKLNGSMRSKQINSLIGYLESNLNTQLEIKSLNILHTLFNVK